MQATEAKAENEKKSGPRLIPLLLLRSSPPHRSTLLLHTLRPEQLLPLLLDELLLPLPNRSLLLPVNSLPLLLLRPPSIRLVRSKRLDLLEKSGSLLLLG